MGKRIFVLGISVFCLAFLHWCSMMPNNDEIINWSIDESEIINPELWMTDNEVDVDWIEDIDDFDEFEDNIDENEYWGENTDVEFEVIE